MAITRLSRPWMCLVSCCVCLCPRCSTDRTHANNSESFLMRISCYTSFVKFHSWSKKPSPAFFNYKTAGWCSLLVEEIIAVQWGYNHTQQLNSCALWSVKGSTCISICKEQNMLGSAILLHFYWLMGLIQEWGWVLSMLVTMASTLVDLRDNEPSMQSADWTFLTCMSS